MKIQIEKDIKNKALELRFKRTLSFIKKSSYKPELILDLGSENTLSKIMNQHGYQIKNTSIDLDKDPTALSNFTADTVTAFEILEHLLNPLGVLENLTANHLFATVPLRLWFSTAYRNENDPWDQHFHEFEDWQFDWLLNHAGWEIIRREKWTSPVKKIGIRPLLRLVTPRYYAVEAVRK